MQIITRTSTETTFSIDKEIKIKIDSETRFCVSSSNYFAVSLSNSIAIFKNYLKITEIQNIKAIELQFSSSGDFICSFERFVSSDKMHRNLKVFDSNSGLEICSFSHKNQANWLFYWNINDSYFARQSLNEIHFYNAPFKDISSRIIVDNLSSFSISSSSIVAAFCAEKGGLPGSIQLYDLNSKLISRKTIFKGDSATFQWNAVGTAVLVITQTEVDKSGKSYYGETLLYYMSVDGNEGLLVNLDKPGPVHDISWSPNSTEFMVVYGTMPSKSTLFDHRANQIYNFPSAARNFCRFNPNSRIICIAGFGNLNGEIDLWDRKTMTKIATINGSNTSACEWSPDGRYLMTSILYKKLKVDNGIKVWHYQGVLVYEMAVKELHQAFWKPEVGLLFPSRSELSPPPNGLTVSPPKAVVGAYRPPGARGQASNLMNRDLLDSKPVYTMPVYQARKKKTVPGATPAKEDEPVEVPTVEKIKTPESENQKKLKNINKKLKQIQEIKTKIQDGDKVELTQLKKLESEDGLIKELELLSL